MITGIVDALRARKCTPATKLVWICLENRANGHTRFPETTEGAIAIETDLGANTVSRAISWLVANEIIKVERHQRRKTTFHLLRSYAKGTWSAPQNGQSANDVTPQNEGTTSALAPQNEGTTSALAPQNEGTTSALAPQNGQPTFDLGPQNGDSKVPKKESQVRKVQPLRGCADAPAAKPDDPDKRELFSRGVAIVQDLTGKPEPACRRDIGSLLKHAGGDAKRTMEALRAAHSARPDYWFPFARKIVEAPPPKLNGWEQPARPGEQASPRWGFF